MGYVTDKYNEEIKANMVSLRTNRLSTPQKINVLEGILEENWQQPVLR